MLSYMNDPNVESVQPIYIYHTSAWTRSSDQDYPDDFDTTFGMHWYYDESNVREMWQDQDCYNGGASCGGDSNVVVAVIDTGLAYETRTSNYFSAWTGDPTSYNYTQAPEFNPSGSFNLYTNTGETAGSCTDGDDDDDNGYIDDCNGYNPYEDLVCDSYSCSAAERSEIGHPNDDYGHGTFVTGAIASNVDNTAGSVSPAFNVTVMPIKANIRIGHYDPCTPYYTNPSWSGWPSCQGWAIAGSFDSLSLTRAVDYARDNGADVINMSLGGTSRLDSLFEDAIDNAYNAGITIVAASGNDSSAGSLQPVNYPAAYSNVIAVGASNVGPARAVYSNGGSNLDLVAAVGDGQMLTYDDWAWQESIDVFYNSTWGSCSDSSYHNAYWCTYPPADTWTRGDYSATSLQDGVGTSYASPQVAAGAALVKTRFPSLKPAEVRNILNRTATDISSAGWDQQTGYGNLNFEDLWNQGYLTQPSHWRDDFGKRGDQWFVGNFNGDSYDDIALVRDNGTNTQTWWVALSNGSSFNTVTQWRSDFGNRGDHWYVGNFNGDSYDDIALVRDNGIHIQTLWVALSNGSSFNTVSQWRDDFGKRGDQWYVGNFNGDSYDDIALVRDNSSSIQTWWVALSNGSSFNTVSQWRDDFGKRGDQWYVGNFNGDSYDDIALVRDNGTYTQTWWVTLSDGASFDAVATWASDFGNRGDHWYVGDFNGDTYDDISLVRDNTSSMQSWWMAISDGNDFNDISSWRNDFGNRGNQWFIGEFDNDNLSDVAVVIDASPSIQTWWVIFGTL
jgi:hypothetical protein